MSEYNSNCLPSHILKLMSKDQRPKGTAGLLPEEIDAKNEKKTEREIQNQIADYLRLHEITFYNSRMDRKATIGRGLPDFAYAYHGIPIAIEVKTKDGKTSDEQNKCHEKMRENGWKVYVVRSLSEVKIILDSI